MIKKLLMQREFHPIVVKPNSITLLIIKICYLQKLNTMTVKRILQEYIITHNQD